MALLSITAKELIEAYMRTYGFDYKKAGCTAFEEKTYIVTEIDTTAFLSCKGLTNVEIPDTVTKIGIMAFKDCTGLTSITIPNSVVSILYSAFENCTSLTSIELPNNNNIEICDSAFAYCENLKTIVCKSEIPTLLDNIKGFQVFKGIRKSKVTCIVPKGCKEIYEKTKQWKGFNIVEE